MQIQIKIDPPVFLPSLQRWDIRETPPSSQPSGNPYRLPQGPKYKTYKCVTTPSSNLVDVRTERALSDSNLHAAMHWIWIVATIFGLTKFIISTQHVGPAKLCALRVLV